MTKKEVRAIFANRQSIGFSDQQIVFLDNQVRAGKAENIAQYIRKLVNDDMKACAEQE